MAALVGLSAMSKVLVTLRHTEHQAMAVIVVEG